MAKINQEYGFRPFGSQLAPLVIPFVAMFVGKLHGALGGVKQDLRGARAGDGLVWASMGGQRAAALIVGSCTLTIITASRITKLRVNQCDFLSILIALSLLFPFYKAV